MYAAVINFGKNVDFAAKSEGSGHTVSEGQIRLSDSIHFPSHSSCEG